MSGRWLWAVALVVGILPGVAAQQPEPGLQAAEAPIEGPPAPRVVVEPVAELELRVTAAEARTASLRQELEAHEQAKLEELQGLKAHLDDAQKQRATVENVEEADALFQALRAFRDRLERLEVAAVNGIVEAQELKESVLEEHTRQRRTLQQWQRRVPQEQELLGRWRRANDERLRLPEQWLRVDVDYRDRILRLLGQTSSLRRGLEVEVSTEALRRDRANLWQDLEDEAHRILPSLESVFRQRFQALRNFPSRLTDFTLLIDLLVGSFWLIVLALAWWILRSRVPKWVGLLLTRIDQTSRGLRRLEGLKRPAAATSRALIDLGAGSLLLFGPLQYTYPELGLLILVYMQFAAYRLLIGTTGMALARHPETRPALMTLRPATHRLALVTVRVLVIWFITYQFTSHFCEDLLGAFGWSAVLGWGLKLLLAGLAVVLCFAWEPVLRESLMHYANNRVLAWLTRRRSLLLRPLVGLFLALLMPILKAVEVIRSWIPQARSSSPDAGAAAHAAGPPEALIAELSKRDSRGDSFIDREDTDRKLDASHERWLAEKRRGLVALVGDHGDGKHAYLDRWCARKEDEGCEVVRRCMTERLTSTEDAARWVASVVGLEDPPLEAADLADAMHAALSQQIIVLEDLHMAFLRCVDGFGALELLLYVLNATSNRCFWVVSMQLPSWRYLSSLDGLVNAEVFDCVAQLEPFDEQQIARLVLQRTEALGYTVSFLRLLGRSDRLGNTDAALERARTAYFRVLARGSNGNPAVALRLWRESLLGGPADSRQVSVRIPEVLTQTVLGDVRDDDLFVLAAIYTHRVLNDDELVAVTNMSRSAVRATVKNLESRGVLRARAHSYLIQAKQLALVTRTLRRRRFIHWSP